MGMYKKRYQTFKSIIFPVIGLIAMSAFVAGWLLWETVGRERFTCSDILVASEEIKAGTAIEANDARIQVAKVETHSIMDGSLKNKEDIEGLAAVHTIPKGAQLHASYFDTPDVITKDDEKIYRLPNEWIKAVPGSIRRKDVIYIYEVNSRLFLAESQQKPAASAMSEKEGNLETLGRDQLDLLALKEPLVKAAVAYVKDSTNREVVTLSSQERYDASATISEVDVIMTAGDYGRLAAAVESGNKLILAYKEN